MSTGGECRPVGGVHRLHLARLATASHYVASRKPDTTVARAVTLGPLEGEDRATIRRRVADSVVAICPDWSGSTFSVWGGDPHDAIGAAGESLFALQARSGGGTGVVIPWGTCAPEELAAGPVDLKRGFRPLKKALRERVNLGGNDMPAALRLALRRLPALRAEQGVAIYVVTDGIEPVTADTHAAIAALPENACHLLIIDPLNGCTSSMQDDWRSVAWGSVTRIEKLTVRGLGQQLAEIYATTLGLTLRTTPTRAPSALTGKRNAS